VCIDGQGEIADIVLDHSTGFGVWDSKVKTAIKAWKARPIDLGASTARMCGHYTLAYRRQ
jgi:hypothetical protein